MKGHELYETMRRFSLFHGLSDEAVTKLCTISRSERYTQNEVIFGEDEPVDALYLIISGKAGVLRIADSEKREYKSLGIIGEGELFGELALFDTQTRSASVVAYEDLHLLKIAISDFQNFLQCDSESASKVLFELLAVLSRRLRDSSREQVALYETGKVIASSQTLDDLVTNIFSIVMQAIPAADSGFLALHNRYIDIIEIKASRGLSPEEVGELHLSRDEPLVKILMKRRDSWEGDTSSEDLFRNGRFSHGKSVIACPIFSRDTFLGLITLWDHRYENSFTPAQRNLLAGICSQCAPAFENAALRQDDVNRIRLKRMRF